MTKDRFSNPRDPRDELLRRTRKRKPHLFLDRGNARLDSIEPLQSVLQSDSLTLGFCDHDRALMRAVLPRRIIAPASVGRASGAKGWRYPLTATMDVFHNLHAGRLQGARRARFKGASDFGARRPPSSTQAGQPFRRESAEQQERCAAQWEAWGDRRQYPPRAGSVPSEQIQWKELRSVACSDSRARAFWSGRGRRMASARAP